VRPARKAAKRDAAETARTLLESAVGKSVSDIELARAQGSLARRVMLKFNVRLDYSMKRFLCHGCKKLLVPGANARVRLGRTGKIRVLRVICLECGHVNRKLLTPPRKLDRSLG
jgi:ribonuclease P protein subunit RPR2